MWSSRHAAVTVTVTRLTKYSVETDCDSDEKRHQSQSLPFMTHAVTVTSATVSVSHCCCATHPCLLLMSNLYLHPCWSAVCPSRWIESWLVPDCGSPNKTSTIGVSNIIASTAIYAKMIAQFARAAVFASTADAKDGAHFARATVFASTADAK